ncbi:hypothetical protein [Shewanella polaris]|uniref:hypothetical protein n=1 Tax=Shewanella polaris TaxID=2588449 RepID=UPI00142E9CA7|nr:hypothetical protein [Shewanella polaris]
MEKTRCNADAKVEPSDLEVLETKTIGDLYCFRQTYSPVMNWDEFCITTIGTSDTSNLT